VTTTRGGCRFAELLFSGARKWLRGGNAAEKENELLHNFYGHSCKPVKTVEITEVDIFSRIVSIVDN
jgi:hypothetical protein